MTGRVVPSNRFITAFKASIDGFMVVDPKGRIVDCNAALARLTGYDEAELTTIRIPDIEALDTAEEVAARIERMTVSGGERFASRIRRKDGTLIDVEVSVSLADGYFFTFVRDTTESKATLGALRESEAKYHALFETANDGIFLLSAEGYLDCNQKGAEMYGRSRESLLGCHPGELSPPRQPDGRLSLEVVAEKIAAVQRGETSCFEWQSLHADGTLFDVEVMLSYINFRGVPCTQAIVRDITERKRVAAELARSNAELEQFAYAASHDLQEPLRLVASYLQLLARSLGPRLQGDEQEYLNHAVEGAHRMQSLIRDLLKYARITRGSLSLVPTDSLEACDTALVNLAVPIQACGATILMAGESSTAYVPGQKLAPGAMPCVLADKTQLTRLFQNLIGNAIKYHDPARPPVVRLSARREGDVWRFAVADNGIGIEPRFFERIFQIFQRLHGKGQYEGTGIGLAMCKKIVEYHGGTIHVESTPGVGSTFWFDLKAVD
ncbi:MAG: PAS domain S-box protein [Alphaproteobacteria bacterium]|nr:PAS domain S-box protein [Alphaproteobacteria bacterium]